MTNLFNTVQSILDNECTQLKKVKVSETDGNKIYVELHYEEDLAKSMAVALRLSSFGKTIYDFMKGVDDLIRDDEKWIAGFNQLFNSTAEHNKRNYCIQVIKS